VRKLALIGVLASTAAAVVGAVLADPAHAQRTETLAEGPVMALPPGPSFLSIVDFRQPPGESFGPHSHVPGFVYVMSGKATLVDDGSEVTLNRGEGHFIPALAVHTHENADDRRQAGALALALVVAVIALVLVATRRRVSQGLVGVLLVALIAGGAIALWDPWKNDWLFIGVRPESARGAPMPIPGASRTYESPAFPEVLPAPYVERLATTTVDPRGQTEVSKAAGPVVFLVLDGRADVTVGNETPIRLGHHQGTLVQAGERFRVLNPSGTTLRLLRFDLIPGSSP
jgi:mannose-6-phosphate isomerase-like protein (cupin superfamily)